MVLNEFWEVIGEYPSSVEAGKAFAIKNYAAKRLAQEKGLKMLKNSYRFVYKEDYGSLNPSEMEGGSKK